MTILLQDTLFLPDLKNMYNNNNSNTCIPRNDQWLNSDPKMLLFNGILLQGSDACSNISFKQEHWGSEFNEIRKW